MEKGTGLGEMTKSLLLLISTCYFLMCVCAISKWDVRGKLPENKDQTFLLCISQSTFWSSQWISIIVFSHVISHNSSVLTLSEGKNYSGDESQFSVIFGILFNNKLHCGMVKPHCLSLNGISAIYRILGE